MMQLLSDTLDNRQHRTVMPEGREQEISPLIDCQLYCLQFQSTALRGRTQTKPVIELKEETELKFRKLKLLRIHRQENQKGRGQQGKNA